MSTPVPRPATWRCLLLLALALIIGAASERGFAADDQILVEATARRQQAEDQLAQLRAGIITQRAQLAKTLDDQTRQLVQLRSALEASTRARDEAQATAKKLSQEHDADLLQLRQAVERAVISAHLDPVAEAEIAKGSPQERLTAAINGLTARLVALGGKLALSYAPEPIVARDGALVTVPVVRLGAARAVAIGTTMATRGVLTRVGDGRQWVVAGTLLPNEVASGDGLAVLPLDPDNSLSKQQAVNGRSFEQWLRAGRFFIWPIMGVLLTGLWIAAERVIQLVRGRIDPARVREVLTLLRAGDQRAATRLVLDQGNPLNRILTQGIQALGLSRVAREAVLESSMLAEAPRLQRGMGLLMVLASIAPLLGLLGTVTGMIDMFSVIASHGSGNAKSLSGAISEALITTQAGMIVAVPLLLIHAILSRLVERRLMSLEEGATALLGVEAPETRTVASAAGAVAAAATTPDVSLSGGAGL